MKWNGQSFIIITTKGIAVKALCCVLVMICQCQRKSDQTTIFHYVWFNCRIISLYNFSFIQFAGTHQILMKTILYLSSLLHFLYSMMIQRTQRNRSKYFTIQLNIIEDETDVSAFFFFCCLSYSVCTYYSTISILIFA